jgi:hypothetical protein
VGGTYTASPEMCALGSSINLNQPLRDSNHLYDRKHPAKRGGLVGRFTDLN